MRLVVTPAILFVLMGAGCSFNKQAPPLRYAINPKPEIAEAQNNGKSLAVRPLESPRPYKQNVVYREGDELHTYSLLEWAELPADAVTRALIDSLNASHRFADVAKAVDIGIPDMILNGQLRRFDLVRDSDPWKAVCEVRLELRQGPVRTLLWAKILTAEEPLATNSNQALATAMNTAVKRVIEQAATEIVTK